MSWPHAAHPTDRRHETATPPSLRSRLTRRADRVRRGVLARRRALAAMLLAVSVLAGLRAVAPPPPGIAATVAARDLPAGASLDPDDLTTQRLPAASVPDGALTRPEAAGRTLAAPVRRGEPLTDVRLTGPDLADGYPGRVAVPVRIPDAAVAGLLRVGDEVEVLAVGEPDGVSADPTARAGAGARTVALARVAGLPGPERDPAAGTAGAPAGRLVLLAATPAAARDLAAAGARDYLTVVWSR